MLQLHQIKLVQYRNYLDSQYDFSKKVVGIAGPNGSGKTNLLDAIYYLCFTKSYFAGSDAQLVHQEKSGFRIAGSFGHPQLGAVGITAILRETGKKEFSCNSEAYTRLSMHIGKLPAVMIAPDDVILITGGSEERRKMLDTLLCQINAEYLQQLMAYNKLLLQRNSLLRQFADAGKLNLDLLEVLDAQLIARATYIYDCRLEFLGQFLPKAVAHYNTIARREEGLAITYQSQLHQTAISDLLRQNRQKDLLLQRTSAGIHRDDLKIELSGQPFKQFASQGQRKSLLFALKLTEFEVLQQQKGFPPILLLDDVFEKLDGDRMINLLREVCLEKQGQVFITDTHSERLQAQLSAIGCDFEIITPVMPASVLPE